MKNRVLDVVAPQLPARMLPAAVAASETIRDYDGRAVLLIEIARRLREVPRANVLDTAIDFVARVHDANRWAELTTSLIPLLPVASRRQLALDAAERVLGDLEEKQLGVFTVALSALPPTARQRLLKRAWAAVRNESNPGRRAIGAVKLLPYLERREEAISLVLSSVPELVDPNRRVPIIRDASDP
jgi:hypothetical protein